MTTISIRVRHPRRMRYRTVGDWYWNLGKLTIDVADTTKWKSNFAIAVHELVEAFLCKQDRILQEAVDSFDMANQDLDEPGDHIAAPYHKQHQWATAVESIVVFALGMSWQEHDRNCDFAYQRTKKK